MSNTKIVPICTLATLGVTLMLYAQTDNSDARGANERGLLERISDLEKKVTISAPVGEIIEYGAQIVDNGSVIEPIPGYLLCNGARIDAATSNGKFTTLIATLDKTWGNGGGLSGGINLPDLRGVVLRGFNGMAADNYKDPEAGDRKPRLSGGSFGNRVGSFQLDQFKVHRHEMEYAETQPESGGDTPWLFDSSGDEDPQSTQRKMTGAAGGQESRPKNAAVAFLIRF